MTEFYFLYLIFVQHQFPNIMNMTNLNDFIPLKRSVVYLLGKV